MSSRRRGSVATVDVPEGAYHERIERRHGTLDRAFARLAGPLIWRRRASWRRWARFPSVVDGHATELQHATDDALAAVAGTLREDLRRHGLDAALVARSFALVREVAARTIGLRHFDVQLIGGRVLLDGMVAEMETGEGKTLVATLAAGTAALAGIPVHVITVNDYLAARDAEWMGPIYRGLGLGVAAVTHEYDHAARQAAYRSDVVYVSNKELTFDYLRDRLVLGPRSTRFNLQVERLAGRESRMARLILRGLHYAIVDEADSVLIDEARTPLIISGGDGPDGERRIYATALALADSLREGEHFTVETSDREVRLTDAGLAHLDTLAQPLRGVWAGRMYREELVRQGLVARHLFHRDRHYLVADGKVQIVDEFTGRLMPDRSWEHGLHQLIEVKESCTVTARHESLARISYQRFFRRYLRLAGMTGTGREVRPELWSVYRLAVVSIPTHRPLRRRPYRDRVYVTDVARWDAVVRRAASLYESGRPLLIGTRSVAASEHLSQLLADGNLPHRVLNARQDGDEAKIVAEAGELGQITVATNMAGRGTDIRLGGGVAKLGGLHVIATERHEARRIDRQLFGRCGRQGDPGSYQALLSLDDEIFVVYAPHWRRLTAWLAGRGRVVPGWIAWVATRRAQRRSERILARMRADLLRLDEHLASALAFSGRRE